MKTPYAFLVIFSALSLNAEAAVKKVCDGSDKFTDSAGQKIEVSLGKKEIDLVRIEGKSRSTYTFTATGSKANESDGKVYLVFEGEEESDFETVKVDQNLLRPGSSGLVKIHTNSGAEGSSDSEFSCQDEVK
jgi:hypothetical protein